MANTVFDPNQFRQELATLIASELAEQAHRLSGHVVLGLAIDCAPWHSSLELCLCTELDREAVERWGKWCLADWKFSHFTSTEADEPWPASQMLCEMMNRYWEVRAEENPEEGERALTVILRSCAEALLAPEVRLALRHYQLSGEFDLFVADPDALEKMNYCDLVRQGRI